jgi:hypothetical protein
MHCDRGRLLFFAAILGVLSITPHAVHATTLYIGRTTGGSSAFTSDSSPPVWRAVSSADLPNVADFDAPALGDLDADGDLDVLVGRERGEIIAFRNDGTDVAPRWVRQTAWEVGRTGITRSAPALGDLDGDGDLDLLVGNGGGTVDPYENTGSRSAPRWTARPAAGTSARRRRCASSRDRARATSPRAARRARSRSVPPCPGRRRRRSARAR